MPDVDLAKFGARAHINPGGDGWIGPDIASATAITISHPCHKVTGTTAITTINLPYTGFVGKITLIATAAWTMATGVNIAKAVTMVANEAIELVYDGTLWYPLISDGA